MFGKRILVTGGHGFLGSHVYQELIDKGYNDKNIFRPRRAEYNLIEASEVDEMFNKIKPDIVIHIAADIGGIGYSREHPANQLYNNAMMNLLVQDRAYRNGVEKFVGIGTVCSYPKFAKIPFKESNLWEGYPEETNAAYGFSKKVMLEQSKAYRQQYGFNGIHLLLINLYGPGDNFDINSSHVIPALITKINEAKIKGNKDIILWGDGSPTREFIYVEDAAEAIVLAMENYNSSEPVNVGSGREISIKDLAVTVSKLMDYDVQLKWDTTKPNGQPRRLLDVSKAKKEFGFNAKTSFKDGLQNSINWYLTEYVGKSKSE